jgi:hypothetical protein
VGDSRQAVRNGDDLGLWGLRGCKLHQTNSRVQRHDRCIVIALYRTAEQAYRLDR